MTDSLVTRWNDINNQVRAAAESVGRSSDEIQIIAVSKTQPAEVVMRAFDNEITVFGENYAQELSEKHSIFQGTSRKPEWYYIGHLQTNKVKLIAPFVSMIQSVDSVKLAREISHQAVKYNRRMRVCIQVNTSGEDSKSGCEPIEVKEIISEIIKLPSLDVCGLMTIPSFTATDIELRKEFSLLRRLRDELRTLYPSVIHLSMGMSSDFAIAIQEGATMIRIGTALFGERNYSDK